MKKGLKSQLKHIIMWNRKRHEVINKNKRNFLMNKVKIVNNLKKVQKDYDRTKKHQKNNVKVLKILKCII